MTSREQAIFDKCLSTYKKCWMECYENGHMHALDPTAFVKQRWRPDRKPRPEDYVADFCLAGHAALEKAKLYSRVILFDIFYAGTAPYDRAKRMLDLSEMGWVRWTEEIRTVVGKELEARGIFPLRKYFGV